MQKSSSNNDVVVENLNDVNYNLNINCRTSDNKIFSVKASVLRQCHIFRQMYHDLHLNEINDGSDITLPIACSSNVMKKVIDWCQHHIGVQDPEIKEDLTTRERIWFELNDYEKEFFNVPTEELVELLSAANFLDLKTMYIYGCQSMAALLRDKAPEQIREMLGLEDDLSEEEKEEIRRINVWCKY